MKHESSDSVFGILATYTIAT